MNPPNVSQASSPRFSQLIRQDDSSFHAQGTSSSQETNNPIIQGCIGNPPSTEVISNEIIYPVTTLPSISISWQEILILSNVLDRIPRSFLTADDADLNQPLALTVVDDVTTTTSATTSSQEEMVANTSTDIVLHGVDEGSTTARGKRRREKHSLIRSMFKRHPVMMFSATGPLDKDKTL